MSDVERETAIRWAVRLDGLLARADASISSLAHVAERANADRDTAFMRLSTCAAEAAAFRSQRDEAVRALADLLRVVDQLTLDDSPPGPTVTSARRVLAARGSRGAPPSGHWGEPR